jgi:hypothetical protein
MAEFLDNLRGHNGGPMNGYSRSERTATVGSGKSQLGLQRYVGYSPQVSGHI